MVSAYCAWLLLAGISQVIGGASAAATLLWYVRYPLEYIPIVFIAPLVLKDDEELRGLGRTVVLAALISFGFLMLEMLSDRPTGIDWGGIYRRYGSIFGSANDFGMFCSMIFVGLLALGEKSGMPLYLRVALLGGPLFRHIGSYFTERLFALGNWQHRCLHSLLKAEATLDNMCCSFFVCCNVI